MPPLLSSKSLARKIVGSTLARVKRFVFMPEYECFDSTTRDESSDGPIEFTTGSGFIFHVLGNTEDMSVELRLGPCPRLGETFVERDVSANAFWSHRLGKKIRDLDALQSLYGSEDSAAAFALELTFSEAEPMVIEYLSDNEHLDQIRITNVYNGPRCKRINLARENRDSLI